MQELFDRCNAAVAEYKAEHNGEFEKDSRGYDIEGMGFAAQHDALGLSSRTKNFYNQVIDYLNLHICLENVILYLLNIFYLCYILLSLSCNKLFRYLIL